jgi:GNAT superfamily N-acetyltransferase
MLLDRARHLWCSLARARVSFPAGGSTVAVSPYSLLCPPGWAGVISLGPSTIATVPRAATTGPVRAALHHLPAAETTDPRQLRAVLPIAEILGPAALAYADDSVFEAPDAPAVPVASDDPGLADLLAAAPRDDAAESGLDEITSAPFVVRRAGQVVAAAGWQRWPTGVAHLSVLTAPEHRGRGFAHAAAGRAVADALAAGLLPQWRARSLASRHVARALGFRELGSQLSFRLED